MEDFAFGYPSGDLNNNCVMVGYLVEFDEWNSAPCKDAAGDVVCQSLPKKI